MNYTFSPNRFQLSKKVTWGDVISKMDVEFSNGHHKIIVDYDIAPTIILHSDYYPGSIQDAFDEVNQSIGVNILHVYTSLGRNAKTFGRHCDTMNVLIVQSIGTISYLFDCGSEVTLNPGDSIYIPAGVYHDPIVSEPRVTLSFSWN